MTKKVIILGGGVGGLTVAHELARCGGYDIHIYEKNETIGGMARSGFKEREGLKLPTEYCWRIYGPNYHNLREILKQIPLIEDPAKYVHDQLVDIRDYLIADQGNIFFMNNNPMTLLNIRRAFKNVTFSEKWSVLSKIIYCFMISNERLNILDALSWNEYINPKDSLSPDMRKYIVDIMAPYLGAEARSVNVPSVVKTLESFKFSNRPISVMNGPTNQAWFDHWKVDLESKGVSFHLNSKVKDINANHDKIESIELIDGFKITGDHFFSCLPVEGVANMPSLEITGIKELANLSYQLMVGIQLYFDKKIILPHPNTAMYIPDSQWLLVIEPQGSIWDKQYGDIADFWSIGLCDPIRPGLIVKKPFIECSHDEIKKEVWYQILTSEFGRYLNLQDIQIVDYNVWDTYVFNGQKIETEEPKFSTNKGTYFLRPDNTTNYKNLYFATAYTKTETDMFEMESAVESGRRAARILEKTVKVIDNNRPLFFVPYRWLDGFLPQMNFYHRFPFLFLFLGLPFAVLTFLWNKSTFQPRTPEKEVIS